MHASKSFSKPQHASAGLEHNGQVFHYNEDANGDVMEGARLEWQRTAG